MESKVKPATSPTGSVALARQPFESTARAVFCPKGPVITALPEASRTMVVTSPSTSVMEVMRPFVS